MPRHFILAAASAAAYVAIAWSASPPIPASYADRMGTRYTAAAGNMDAPPRITEIPIPAAIPGDAIWGGTGRDMTGHIWFGVSDVGSGGSAHLLEYDPRAGTMAE